MLISVNVDFVALDFISVLEAEERWQMFLYVPNQSEPNLPLLINVLIITHKNLRGDTFLRYFYISAQEEFQLNPCAVKAPSQSSVIHPCSQFN